MLLALLVIAATSATVKFPEGLLDLPPGCEAPREVPMVIDAYIGFIECRAPQLRIVLSGGAASSPACGTQPRPGSRVTLRSNAGLPFVVCTRARPTDRPTGPITMVIALAGGSLEADIATPRDALFLLQLAASWRLPAKQ